MRLDWRGLLYALARPILFRFDPERFGKLDLGYQNVAAPIVEP